jgi:sugar phosphate permease
MEERTPQINVSKIPGGGGIAGALFAVISLAIFLIGIPALRYFFLGAIVLGCVVSLVIHFIRRETPGKSWILPASEKLQMQRKDPPEGHRTHVSDVQQQSGWRLVRA